MKSKKVSKEKSTAVEEKKKGVRWTPIIALAVIFIMVASSLILMNNNSSSSYDYNGFSVTKTDDGWYVSKGQGSVLFSYDPKSVENIPNQAFVPPGYKVYMIINDSYSQEATVLSSHLEKFGISVNDACFEEKECPDVPIVSCNSTSQVIYFTDSNASITRNNNCQVLNAPHEESMKVIDAYLYKIAGVL